MYRSISRMLPDEEGNVLLLTGLVAPVLVGFAGLAVDVGFAHYSKAKLRGATEAAALSLAESFTAPHHFVPSDVGRWNHDLDAGVKAALAQGRSNIAEDLADGAFKEEDIHRFEWNPVDQVQTEFNPGEDVFLNAVRVDGELSAERGNRIPSFFASLFGFEVDLKYSAHAVAPFVPTFHILNANKSGAFKIAQGADIDSGALWINSNSPSALVSATIAGIGNSLTITAGGAIGSDTESVWEGKFPLPDLLFDQKKPSRPLFCDHQNRVYSKRNEIILQPGSYCGGLTISEVDRVRLTPGEYLFIDGPLRIEENSRVYGEDVFLHFDGAGASLQAIDSRLEISARESGDYQGLVLSSKRNPVGTHHIVRDSHLKVSGTVHLPSDAFLIDSANVDGTCHTLCFVADTMELTDGSFINWYPDFGSLPSSVNQAPRKAPIALVPYLKPYLYYPD